jgi:hypothetical protein
MKSQRLRLCLLYLPPVLLGLGAAAISPSLRTGDPRYDEVHDLRSTLLVFGILYLVGMCVIRATVSVLRAATLSVLHAADSINEHRAKKMAGRCLTCGYDLRATPIRCPECGTPVATLKILS